MHRWPLIYRYDGFRRWRAIAQCTVGSLSVVVLPPFFNHDLSFTQAIEYFTIE